VQLDDSPSSGDACGVVPPESLCTFRDLSEEGEFFVEAQKGVGLERRRGCAVTSILVRDLPRADDRASRHEQARGQLEVLCLIPAIAEALVSES
jgi:hypothetical protein